MKSLLAAAFVFFSCTAVAALYSAFTPPVSPGPLAVIAIDRASMPISTAAAAPPPAEDVPQGDTPPSTPDTNAASEAPPASDPAAETEAAAPERPASDQPPREVAALEPPVDAGETVTTDGIDSPSTQQNVDPTAEITASTDPGEPIAEQAAPGPQQADTTDPAIAVPAPLQRPSRDAVPAGSEVERLAALDQRPAATAAVPDGPVVSVLVRGLGFSSELSEASLSQLPATVALGILPYGPRSRSTADAALARGHELIVQLPLEPDDYPASNPGPDTLLTTAAPDENTRRLDTILERFPGKVGATNFFGGKMLKSPEALMPVMTALAERGLVYVGETSAPGSPLVTVARQAGLRYSGANAFIRGSETADVIDKALDRTVQVAKQRGRATVIAHASAMSIERLALWTASLSSQGVTLVPIGQTADSGKR